MADRLTIKCACGCPEFKGLTPNPKPDDVITCARCGASNDYRTIQKEALVQGTKAVEDAFRSAFKGIKGIKLK